MWYIHPTRAQYTLLSQYLSPLEARIDAGLLNSEGIDSLLLDENMVWNNQMYAQAIGGVKLLVPKCELENALNVLDKLYQGKFAITDEGEDGEAKPKITPKNGVTDYMNMLLVFLLFFVAGLALPISNR